MKHLLTLFFCYAMLSFSFLQAQSFDYQFEGTIDIQDVGTFDYSLNFNIDPLGKIVGVSISDVGGTFETQSKIEGTLDSTTQLMRFQEVSVVQSKVKQDEYELCLIQSNAFNFEEVRNNKTIDCLFTGRLVNGKKCGAGKINLTPSKPLPARQLRKPEIIFEGPKTMSLEWADKEFVLEVWDNQRKDGDSIQVLVNGVAQVSIEITKDHQFFRYSVPKGTTKVSIIALNEGSAAFNTLIGELIDGDTVIPFSSKLSAGQKIEFTLVH